MKKSYDKRWYNEEFLQNLKATAYVEKFHMVAVSVEYRLMPENPYPIPRCLWEFKDPFTGESVAKGK